ncbi:MAG: hypothetical protein A2X23_06545 [Chloroflexi bacterium GWC2_73_18]|nr:MAG: hypothetical protein A2X23_06545 [Chloroflexi bacterium GWC2_73_18]
MDASGIALVGPEAIQFRAENEAQALAFDAALNLALGNRADMGYPWIDLDSKTLELSAINERGEKAALLAEASLPAAGLTTRVTTAQTSIARLDEIADDATRLIEAGVPHADLVWMTEPDQKNNRVVMTVGELNDELMSALASRFGTDLIAVRVHGPRPTASTASRDRDYSPFWGGANFWGPTGGCTTGFAWNVGGGVAGMLTAAHCAPAGGNVYYDAYPNIAVGSVRSGSEENWSTSAGTQYYTGQTVYRGDVALIRYNSPYSSAPKIYTGGNDSSTHLVVGQMNSTWAQLGQSVCSSGVVTNSWCGMVTTTGVNVWYVFNGIGVWARHMDVANALGPNCPTRGDSGSPMYQQRADGKVKAFGVLSGSAPVGVMCEVYFTDIWDSYYGLPGTLKTG